MRGLMQDESINLISMLIHASKWHGEQRVITSTVEGGLHTQTYRDTMERTVRLAARLRSWGVMEGDRIATLGWNTHRHLEAWYAISGQGAICHTVNPRLFPEQIQFIVNHASDRLIFVDLTFVELLGQMLPTMPAVEGVVVMTDQAHMPDLSAWPVDTYCYEDFLADGDSCFDWPVLDDNAASSLCYTSGTTGEPKGVLYSHRGNVLHAYASCSVDVLGISAMDTILMVVPMFHANSWGIAYVAPLAGAKLVLPGPNMSGEAIHSLVVDHDVTKAAAVPTVWKVLIDFLRSSEHKLDCLEEVIIGGAAVPRSMIEAFDQEYGVNVIHAWGMTEMSPIGTVNRPKPFVRGLDESDRLIVRSKQGRVPYGVDLKVVDDNDEPVSHDGETFGRLLVKGPWIVSRYYQSEDDALENGWFDTGDIATIDEHGYMQITDRSKDVIKSGGEWISSVDLENAVMGMLGIALAACIGAKHAKWDERPILLVQLTDRDNPVAANAIIEHLGATFAKWQLPDAILYVDEIPLTATGKIDKKPLRSQYEDHLLDS